MRYSDDNLELLGNRSVSILRALEANSRQTLQNIC